MGITKRFIFSTHREAVCAEGALFLEVLVKAIPSVYIVGKGSYAAKRNKELIREEYLCRIERHLEKVTELAKSIGLSNKESKLL